MELFKKILNERESKYLSKYAALSSTAVRRFQEYNLDKDYRFNFSIDADRILNSLAYSRYIDKTQVFYLIKNKNDHITHRIIHVQLASKIGRTIGRFLDLNEDLIEAIAIGHDIGHTPFGHDGETILSDLCKSYGIDHFRHNIQSAHFLDKVERKGKGCNLSLQTLDGILCHDGEIYETILMPQQNKTFEIFESEIENKKKDPNQKILPMTMEGCVVRISDIISYIGRDIEDAIRLNIIKRNDIPKEIADFIGNTNGTIVYNLVTDVINKSHEQPYIALSNDMSKALKKLKTFNFERIYFNPENKKYLNAIQELFKNLFECFLNDIIKKNRESSIFTDFLENMAESYIEKNKKEEIVRDFIAGMTDNYFLKQCGFNNLEEFYIFAKV